MKGFVLICDCIWVELKRARRIAVRLGSCTSHSAPVQRGLGPPEPPWRQVTIHQSQRGDRWEPSFHGPSLTSPRTKWLDTMRQPCSLTEGQRLERHSCQANGERTHTWKWGKAKQTGGVGEEEWPGWLKRHSRSIVGSFVLWQWLTAMSDKQIKVPQQQTCHTHGQKKKKKVGGKREEEKKKQKHSGATI